MGISFSGLFSRLWKSNSEHRILILGLDNAGKTTILYRLHIGEVVATVPTIGFNVETLKYKGLTLNCWDLGGQSAIRAYWRSYYSEQTKAVIFVLDSTDLERLELCSYELHEMLKEDELREAALLVLANKQDQPNASSASEIAKALNLSALKDRQWTIKGCSAITGEGLAEGMNWLVDTISEEEE